MVDHFFEIVWTKRSQQNMLHAYNYISKESPKNALMVIEAITNAVYKAIQNPGYYNPDK